MVPKRLRPRIALLAAVGSIALFVGGGATAGSACAVDFSVKCGDTAPAFFSHDSHGSQKTFKVTNSGQCNLLVHSRQLGESQPTNHVVDGVPPGHSRSAEFTGKFVDFAVICHGGHDPCKGSVTH
jgi:hypothetical protein